MSVTVEPRQFTPDQIREHVLAYTRTKHGRKAAYLEVHEIGRDQMYRWRAAFTDGDLDSGKIPRQSGRMTHKDISEIERLKRLLAERDSQIDELEGEIDRSRKVADALGKAIDVMHSHGVEPDKAESD
ncbi:hypothetical protein [Dietzia alimentaria]|uniref:hypothetical protein n=1 Tax=Dietzia alimentaria TaxID=665550 RepID=UPI00029B2F82|nr:hypothetical protein [Dietzia alimentaria]